MRIFNINIATFVGFQIVVYAYVVLRTFTYTSDKPSSPWSHITSALIILRNGTVITLFYGTERN